MSYFYPCILYVKSPQFEPVWIDVDGYVKEKVLFEDQNVTLQDDSIAATDKINGIAYVTTYRIIIWDGEKGFEIPLIAIDDKISTEKFY